MITADTLRAKGACQDQIDLFAQLFPDGVHVTVEAAVAVAGQFDWDWAARNLLSKKGMAAYEAAKAPAWAAYEAAEAPAWAAYEAATAPAWAEAYIADQVPA
jgi:hypothetical protein